MIERLRIEEFALVERLELEFGPGLNVLTGETGAGKSLVLGALGLMAGGRAPGGALRDGAGQAVVEALFDTRALPELRDALRARGFDSVAADGDAGDGDDEDGALIVRRSLSRGGRSRAWLGGQLVPVSTLAELFAQRFEVSSQHASQALLRPEAQSRLLDGFAGLLPLRAELAQGVAEVQARAAEIAELSAAAEERARREDYLRFQVDEIDAAELDAEGFRALESEHARLVHAERLREGAGRAMVELQGDALASDERAAADRLGGVKRTLQELAELDPELSPQLARASALQNDALDLASDLERYVSGIEVSAARLTAVEERIAVVEALRRKYGESVEAILATREAAAAELATLSGSDERLQKLEAERKAAFQTVEKLAQKLSRGRSRAARALGKEARDAIRTLALENAEFEVALEPQAAPEGLPCAPGGAERIAFLFSANPGEALQPLKRVASGGERSRIFLALKNVLRRASAGMVLLFDEVDAGIGGAVAERVGAVLSALATDHQVLCITHLPQIACQATRHFRVSKAASEGRTTTRIELLSESGRVDELARMAGGEQITDATRRHARALLRAAQKKH